MLLAPAFRNLDAVLEEAAKLASEVLSPLNRVGDTVGCKWEDGVVTTPPGWREAFPARSAPYRSTVDLDLELGR